MHIEVREIEPCKLCVQYTAEPSEISDKKEEVVARFKKAPVSGFRTGKVPTDVIKMHYRTQIEDALKVALAEEAYHNALFEKKLRPHGAPKLNSAILVDGKFVCEFEMHTKPEFQLMTYDGMQIPRPHEALTVTELTEKMLQELRVKYGDSVPYADNEFVQVGDTVIVDYEGSINGEVLPHLSATGEMITVGHSNLPQFDDNVLGMSIGETREFDIVVPQNSLPSLSGKTVHLKVTLNMGSKNVPHPLDDTLGQKLGKKDLQELRMAVGATAMATVENKVKESINEAVAIKLVEMHEINVPNWMALSEAQYLVHGAKLDWNALRDEDKDMYVAMAAKNVKLSLILDRIRDDNPEAQLTDQEVFDMIKRNLMQSNMQQPLEQVVQQMQKSGYLQVLFARIRDEHAMDFVTKKVQLID
jgi:trigger factor